jgi:radical SAM protein with 4Fe4S-binding SPASM domain
MAYLVSSRSLLRYLRRYRHLFSWKRLWNLAAVLASLGISRLIGRPVVWGHPFMLMVEPTNYCNLKCPLCPSGNGQLSRNRGHMRLEDFKSLVDQVHDRVFMIMMWNQGEPFLNRSFNEMVRYAHDRRIFTFVSTNGHFIRTESQAGAIVDSGLDEIIFSVDGVDQATYEKYRVGGRLERVLTGIRLLVQAKEQRRAISPLVNLQFIVMKHNQDGLEAAARVARELKVDKFLVKTAQVYTAAEAEEYLPSRDEFSRYEGRGDGRLEVKGQPARGCNYLWNTSMVNWDGTVSPCCFDKNAEFEMGRAFTGASFRSIWRGRAYADFRRRLLADRMNVAICANCSEGHRGMFAQIENLK